ncbi:putative sugar transporter [Aureobasidium pullulans]|uniref:Putative sugar transporter n=1 Tax=Aureobasidium pullulans TaxID=5580 RepID=A0A4S9JKW9_AURPU|nr:putative sugar transporter [Aureobasidium pullulans]
MTFHLLKSHGDALLVFQTIFVVAPSFILYGYNLSGLGGLVNLSTWASTFSDIDTVFTTGATKTHDTTIQGVVVACFTLGAIVGSFSCTFFGDTFGRKKLMFSGALFTLIGTIIQASSFSLAQLIFGRIILGNGVGQLSATVPVWQSECSKPGSRGKHVIMDGVFMAVGYFLESWINLGFYFTSGTTEWRAPIAISAFFSLVILASVFSFPESPRWLVRMNRIDEACSAPSRYKGEDEQSDAVAAELSAIEAACEDFQTQKASLGEMFTMGEEKLAYRFGLCMLLQFFQQMCGSNLVSVYSTIIYQENLGLSSITARTLSGGMLTFKLLSCSVAFWSIDRLGRRACFMISGAGMGSCMVALAVATSFKDNYGASIAAAFFLFLFCFFTPIGFLGANFLYCTEVASLRLRSSMSSISTANHWIWNFVVNMVTPIASRTIGWKYYLVYACIGAIIPVVVFCYFPETKGRTLEELDIMFKQVPSIREIVKVSQQQQIIYDDYKIPNGKSGIEMKEDIDDNEKV